MQFEGTGHVADEATHEIPSEQRIQPLGQTSGEGQLEALTRHVETVPFNPGHG